MLPQEQAKIKAEEVRNELRRHGLSLRVVPPVEITCEDCPHNDNCDFVWDLYNTCGDCLAMK